MVRVIIADDDGSTREVLREYLGIDPAITVVAEAANGHVVVQQAVTLQPDVILMDMQMPVLDGVAATKHIHHEYPNIAIIGLSTFSTDRYVVDLLRAGASGYLVKDTAPKDIIAAIHSAARGESMLSPSVTRHVVKGLEMSVPAQTEADPELLNLLTKKELEVIGLLARGMSNREMARELYVTESTVKARFVKVMEKLGVRDRVQILVVAYERGLVGLKSRTPLGKR